MIYIVLGMHKSGTTLVSKTLHESGINMGNFNADVGYDEGNKYERMETLMANISLLNIKYKSSSIQTAEVLRSDKGISRLLINYIKRLVFELNNKHPHWGFKDPRTCLTYSIWRKYIPDHKLILVIRSPYEIINHYQKSDSKIIFGKLKKMWKILKTWYVYNNQLLQFLKSTEQPYIVVNYEAFLNSNEVFNALQSFVGMQLFDLRDKKLYRSVDKRHGWLRVIIFLQKSLFKRDANALFNELRAYKKYRLNLNSNFN